MATSCKNIQQLIL